MTLSCRACKCPLTRKVIGTWPFCSTVLYCPNMNCPRAGDLTLFGIDGSLSPAQAAKNSFTASQLVSGDED